MSVSPDLNAEIFRRRKNGGIGEVDRGRMRSYFFVLSGCGIPAERRRGQVVRQGPAKP